MGTAARLLPAEDLQFFSRIDCSTPMRGFTVVMVGVQAIPPAPKGRGCDDAASGSGRFGSGCCVSGVADGSAGRGACGGRPADFGGSSTAVDPVSLQTSAAFSAAGNAHQLVATQGAEELGRSGIGVGEASASYETGDAAAAATYLGTGG
jgi:hypothetical protein